MRFMPYAFFVAAIVTAMVSGAYGEGTSPGLAVAWLGYSALLTYLGYETLPFDDDDDGGDDDVQVPDAPPIDWIER